MNRIRTKKNIEEELPMEAPLKLHYFYIRGQCQPIRNLLYYIQVDFEDIMHERCKQNQGEVGFNIGFPMLQDGDLKIHDALAIMNYLCRKYGKNQLIGLTPQLFARIQEVLIKYALQKKKIIGGIFQIINCLDGQSDNNPIIQKGLKKLLNECKFVEFCLRSISINKGYIFDTLSLVDFLFYQICIYICGFFHNTIKKHCFFKYFIQYKNRFEKLKFFKKYRTKIDQKYAFFQFNNPQINNKIECLWKGSNQCLKKRIETEASD